MEDGLAASMSCHAGICRSLHVKSCHFDGKILHHARWPNMKQHFEDGLVCLVAFAGMKT